MKILSILFMLFITTFTFGQKCETRRFFFSMLPVDFPSEANCIDSLGRKQSWWVNYATRTYQVKNPISGEPNETFEVVTNYSYGKYLNDKRVGKWEYVFDGGDYSVVTKTEDYFDDGSVEASFNEDKEKIRYNADSSEIKCFVEFNSDSVIIFCDQKYSPMDCKAIYQGNVFKQFSKKNLEFEIDRIKIGAFRNEMRNGESH